MPMSDTIIADGYHSNWLDHPHPLLEQENRYTEFDRRQRVVAG